MALTRTMTAPSWGTEARARSHGWLNRVRERLAAFAAGLARGFPIEVRLQSDAHLAVRSVLAARLPLALLEDASGLTAWLTMPAAGRDNTEIVWNEEARRLSVAAWSRPVRRLASGGSRRESLGRMLAYTAFWLPEHDGSSAVARVARGVVTLRVPHQAGN